MKIKGLIVWVFLITGACAPRVIEPVQSSRAASLQSNNVFMEDNARLPLRKWGPEKFPKYVLLALHGFNDYSNAFEKPASYWAKYGVTTYAYDQRGFGEAPLPGRWHRASSLINDFIKTAELIRLKHPNAPLFLLGDSMGGAVVIAADAKRSLPPHKGKILIAPALWGRETMPIWQKATLYMLSRVMPGFRVRGGNFGRKPSDNISMLRALAIDKKVIKRTRIDAVYGLVNLMDTALSGAKNLRGPSLILYGKKEDIIPNSARFATEKYFLNLSHNIFIKEYENGYHMLLRDLSAKIVWEDILNWIRNPMRDPSGGNSGFIYNGGNKVRKTP